jgi:hypothetical protein
MTIFWDKFIDISEVLTASITRLIALMMDAVIASETSFSFYQTTRHNIPEDSNLQTKDVLGGGYEVEIASRCLGRTAEY